MSAGRRVLALVGTIAALVSVSVLFGPSAAGRTATTAKVAMRVLALSPATPLPSSRPRRLTIQLSLTANQALKGVRITGSRGDPVQTQTQLDAAFRSAKPLGGQNDFEHTRPLVVDLARGVPKTVTLRTSTDTIDHDGGGICLCTAGVYPLYLHATDPTTNEQLGVTTTFIPGLTGSKQSEAEVSWVWPLLDAPHRLFGGTVFSDDQLAVDVAPDGRLRRALDVVAQVQQRDPTVPMTLVLDPELLDELEVMAFSPPTAPYTIGTNPRPDARAVAARTKPIVRPGAAAAADWLDTLSTILHSDDGNIQVRLTPYGDPDVESLARAGLSWSDAPPSALADRVTQALAGRTPDYSLAWPAGGRIGPTALQDLERKQAAATTVLLDSRAVRTSGTPATATPYAATLKTASGTVTAALTTAALNTYVARATAATPDPTAATKLLAELRIRSLPGTESKDPDHGAVLVAPRYVDPDVTSAVRTIGATTSAPFTRAAQLTAPSYGSPTAPIMVGTPGAPASALAPNARLTRPPRTGGLAAPQLEAVRDEQDTRSLIRALLVPGKATRTLETDLDAAAQRVASSAFRTDAGLRPAPDGARLADGLHNQLAALSGAVHIVQGSSGSYTLASSNSPLPISVTNPLNYRVRVQVQVQTLNQLPGFTARNVSTTLDPHQTLPLKIPSKVDRSGRIAVTAQLRTAPPPHSTDPGTYALGPALPLTVHSTVLGTIGIVITVVAGAVLVLALLVRFVRRLRQRRRRPPRSPAGRARPLDPQPVGPGAKA